MVRTLVWPLVLIVILSATRSLAAQEPNGAEELVDRVLAVVGDSAILQSELEEEMLRRAAGRPLPAGEEREQLRQQLLDERVNELILIRAAERDSIFADPGQVETFVDQEIAQSQQRIGGERQFREALTQDGLTLPEYREILTRQIRRQSVIEQYLQMIRQTRRPPPVTEEEIREFYDAQGAFDPMPAAVTYRQVVVSAQPNDSIRAATREEGIELIERLREGEDFAQLARRFSDDPGTKETGGDLGWFRRGDMLPAFEDAAFALQPGAIGMTESIQGFHIIKVERARGPERQVRHILLQPNVTDDDVERTRELAEELVGRVQAGESIDQLAREHGDPEVDVNVTRPQDDLPPAYAAALADAEPGAVVGPFAYGETGRQRWVVLRVTEMTDERPPSLDDLRERIRQVLQDGKMMEELVGDLRRRTYVDFRN